MKNMIPKKIRDIEMSGIRKMFEMADKDSINLGLGQPDFQPPADVIDAYTQAMSDGHNGYGSTYGLYELREEVANHLSQYKPKLNVDNILITIGATQSFKISTETLIQEGVEVLYPEPGFVLYEPQIKLADGIPISYPVEQKNEFVPQVEYLEERRTNKTKVIIVNSPGNPTGGVFPKKNVKEIIGWAQENDIAIISDEVYEMMVYDEEHVSFLGDYENVIAINSFSKTFAMTGWRIGFMAARKDWIKEFGKVHYYNIACPPNPPQHAILYAMRNRLDYVEDMVKTFKKRRDIIVDRLNKISGFNCLVPKGAFYVFPSFDFDITSYELVMKLLENGVIASPGSAFGPTGEGHIRFSYANLTENIKAAMDIIEEVVSDLDVKDE
ncbi:MAG: pyridoxal phosphate-dependent aminotransferase [Thermoplasmatota archaeon]